jgi:MFS family permease
MLVSATPPDFFPLGFLARLPYAMVPLATLILLDGATGSLTFAGIAGAAQSIAMAISGPVIGALADRFGQRRIGVITALGTILALLGLIATSQLGRPAMVVAATLAGLTQPQVGPLVRVRWARLVAAKGQPDLLPTALAYEAAADETSFVAGPAVVGLLTSIGLAVPMLASVALLGCATLPFALRHADGPAPRHRSSARLPLRPLGGMFLAMAAIGAIFGVVQTGVTAYATGIGAPGSAGLIYAEFGVGSALAGAACAWLPVRFGLRQRYPSFAATLLLGMIALTVLPVPIAVAVASLTVAPYMISLYGLTERLAPQGQAARTMTIVCAGGPLGTAAGRAMAGHLAGAHGSAGAFHPAPVIAGMALALAVALVVADRGRGTWLAVDPLKRVHI